MFNFEFPEALKKPLDLLYSNVKGARGKKRRKSVLMPRLLRFTFLLSPVCCSACSLSAFYRPSFADFSRPPASVPPSLPTARTFAFFVSSLSLALALRPLPTVFSDRPNLCFLLHSLLFVAPLSLHQNRVSGAKSAPFTLEYSRSRGFLRASRNSKLKMFIFVFQPEGFRLTFGRRGGAG